jgi:cytochrome c biogenesis protein CcmG/thiol:disulfide interchange protein DsbE
MNLLRLVKLTILLAVPFFGAVYVYQFMNQSRETIRPFEPHKAKSLQVKLPGREDALADIPTNAPVIVVNFWATWCPPCVEEFPSILELQRLLANDGLKMVFVSVDDKWSDVEAFMAKYNITVPTGQLFWDPKKVVAASWGSEKFPETYILRPDGWVVEKVIGQQDWTRPAVIEYFRGLLTKFASLTPERKIN